MSENRLLDKVNAEVEQWKKTRVYTSVTTSVDDPDFRISFDDEINIHMGAIYLSMSPAKWRELNAKVESVLAQIEVSA